MSSRKNKKIKFRTLVPFGYPNNKYPDSCPAGLGSRRGDEVPEWNIWRKKVNDFIKKKVIKKNGKIYLPKKTKLYHSSLVFSFKKKLKVKN